MPKIFDEETHLPLNDPDYQVISDDKLPDEDYIPKEELYSFDEFNEHYVAPTINENHRDRIKKMFLKPVISLVLLGAVVLASYGIDPLGKNMLVNKRAIMRSKQPMGLPFTSWSETDRKHRSPFTPLT